MSSSSSKVRDSSLAQQELGTVQHGFAVSPGAPAENGGYENNVEYHENSVNQDDNVHGDHGNDAERVVDDTAQNYSCTPVDQNTTNVNETQQPSNEHSFVYPIADPVSLGQEEQLPAPSDVQYMTEAEMDKTYHRIMRHYGFRPIASAITEPLNENNYAPRTWDMDINRPRKNAPPPLYPAYTGRFQTGEEAKTYRQRARLPPKFAPDLERVKRHGRK